MAHELDVDQAVPPPPKLQQTEHDMGDGRVFVQIVIPGVSGVEADERNGRDLIRLLRAAEAGGLAAQPTARPSQRRLQPRPARARGKRSTRRGATRRNRTRAPDDDGPEPPPASAGSRYFLTCQACSSKFSSARPHTRTCSQRCRQRLYVQSRGKADQTLLQLGDVVWQLVSRGELSPDEALVLIIWPPAGVERALVEAAA